MSKVEWDFMDSARDEPVPDEDALQGWLEEAYVNQGYECYNWHRMERVNEKGMDIECESTEQKVLLAVKIRPKKEDIHQLQKFSEISAARKIYVHWSPPTRDFQRQLDGSNVETLTDGALKKFLVVNASVGYLKWRFIQTTTLRLITKSISEIYECEHVPNRQFASHDFAPIWKLKSAAVKLKADIRLTKNYFGDKIIREKEQSGAARITDSVLDLIYMMDADAKEFYAIVSSTRKEAPHLLRAFIDKISPRTGGKELHNSMQLSETAQKSAKIEEWLIEDKEAYKFHSTLSWLSMTLENLEDRFSLLSYGVDWVFEEILRQIWKGKVPDLSDD
jgi:hypothetical protein